MLALGQFSGPLDLYGEGSAPSLEVQGCPGGSTLWPCLVLVLVLDQGSGDQPTTISAPTWSSVLAQFSVHLHPGSDFYFCLGPTPHSVQTFVSVWG